MIYQNVKKAIFLSRPNRFVAICDVDGNKQVCHVKNTGRCKELLIPNCTVFLEESHSQLRKTKYDIISVLKGEELFNIDSQAPNKVIYEWLKNGNLFDDLSTIYPEKLYKSSRFDFYVEHGESKTFIEVKGVTLEENGVLSFPDAPTERGVKHIKELIDAYKNGYEAYVIFVVQTEKAKYFTPNYKNHFEFGEVLKQATKEGVKVICLNCHTTPTSLQIKDYVKVCL